MKVDRATVLVVGGGTVLEQIEPNMLQRGNKRNLFSPQRCKNDLPFGLDSPAEFIPINNKRGVLISKDGGQYEKRHFEGETKLDHGLPPAR